MGRLTRDAILTVQDVPGEVVPVPEWGGEVYVKALSGGDVLDMAKRFGDANGDIPLLVYSIVDEETGERLFTMADIAALGTKSLAGLTRVLSVIKRISGLDGIAPKATGASS